MKLKRIIVRFIINHMLCCTRFFKIKKILLKFCGIEIGRNTKVVGPIYFGNSISIKIGDNCWIGKNISFDGDGKVYIGNNVDIAPNVVFNTGGHLIGSSKHRAGKGIITEISVGDGCWIGTGALIVNNTTINSGVVVAAGSVVIKNIPNNVLIAGVPAKIKKELDESDD